MTPSGIEFLDFFQSTITSFGIGPSESMGAEYTLQFVELHPVQEILRADLPKGGGTTHPKDHDPVIALQAMKSM